MVKMVECVVDRVETLWPKEKMLVTSIFSFTNSVLKSPPF